MVARSGVARRLVSGYVNFPRRCQRLGNPEDTPLGSSEELGVSRRIGKIDIVIGTFSDVIIDR